MKFLFGLCVVLKVGFSAPVLQLPDIKSYLSMSQHTQVSIAKAWGITPKEYENYIYDMTESPDSIYYAAQTTDPLWVLAAHNIHHPAKFQRYIHESVLIAHRE